MFYTSSMGKILTELDKWFVSYWTTLSWKKNWYLIFLY